MADPACTRRREKVLESLQEHWDGLTVFVEHPEVPMDNNTAERVERGPVVGRKNNYGSGAVWAGELAAMLFSVFQTLCLWDINPRVWLTAYLQACANAAVISLVDHTIVGNLTANVDGRALGGRDTTLLDETPVRWSFDYSRAAGERHRGDPGLRGRPAGAAPRRRLHVRPAGRRRRAVPGPAGRHAPGQDRRRDDDRDAAAPSRAGRRPASPGVGPTGVAGPPGEELLRGAASEGRLPVPDVDPRPELGPDLAEHAGLPQAEPPCRATLAGLVR